MCGNTTSVPGETVPSVRGGVVVIRKSPRSLYLPRSPIMLTGKGEVTFNQDAELVWFMPHMHLRGKDMTFQLIYPDGRKETVLSAKFNFHWQLGYEVENPIKVTKGTRMVVTAHHDNSANNPGNPAPNQVAVWGEMTSQEMMLPWFGVVVNRAAQPDKIASYRPGDFDGVIPPPFVGSPRPGGAAPQPAVLRQNNR